MRPRSPLSATPTTTRRCSAGPGNHTPWATARRWRRRPRNASSRRSAPASPRRSRISSTGWRSSVRKRVKASPHSTAFQVVAVGFVVLTTALVALGFKEAADPRFALRGISVSGEAHTAVTDVVAAAAFENGANVWLLDTGAASRRIEALPWVATAAVHRTWPNRVSVWVTERRAVVRLGLPAVSAEEPMAAEALIDATG